MQKVQNQKHTKKKTDTTHTHKKELGFQQQRTNSFSGIEIYRDMIFTATTTATRAQTTPWKQQQQRPRFLTSRASVSFSSSSSSSSFLSKSSSSKGGGRQQPRRGHRRRRSLPNEDAKTGRGVVVAGRFPDERTYIMIKCVVVYVVVVVFRLSS